MQFNNAFQHDDRRTSTAISRRDEVPFAAPAGCLARESHPHLIRAELGVKSVAHFKKICNSAREAALSITYCIGADKRNHHVVSGPDTLLHRVADRVRVAP